MHDSENNATAAVGELHAQRWVNPVTWKDCPVTTERAPGAGPRRQFTTVGAVLAVPGPGG